jgi:hypothetical protein
LPLPGDGKRCSELPTKIFGILAYLPVESLKISFVDEFTFSNTIVIFVVVLSFQNGTHRIIFHFRKMVAQLYVIIVIERITRIFH